MLIFIDDNDLRGKALGEIFTSEGYNVTTDIKNTHLADFSYLGINGKLYEDSIFKIGSRIYTVIHNDNLALRLEDEGVFYDNLYNDDELVHGGTLLTTEALLSYMIADNSIGLLNAMVLVIGFGNCGKDIAKKYTALDSVVTVTNRGYKYEQEVLDLGYEYVSLNDLSLSDFDFVINTVPAPVISDELLSTFKSTGKIYDIASAPGGLKTPGSWHNYAFLPGLPAKYAYKTSALMFYESIIKKESKYVE